MSAKLIRSKTALVVIGVGLLTASMALTKAVAFPVEFLNAACVTWNFCGQCVNGLGTDIGRSSSECFAAVGGSGAGTAQHCVNDGTHEGSECLYKITDDPGALSCDGAAVYLCSVDGSNQCTCECSGSADLSGLIISDTKLCQTN